jgi:hypothetical protein
MPPLSSGRRGECPGVVGAGESEVDQSAEVEGGGPTVETGVVLQNAEVGHFVVALGDKPGDAAFHEGRQRRYSFCQA